MWGQANGGWGCPKGLRQQNRPFPQRCQVVPSHGAAAKGPAPPPALVRADKGSHPCHWPGRDPDTTHPLRCLSFPSA